MDLPKACLFDLDGVLLDTEKLHSAAWSKAAASYETELSEDQLRLLKGRRRLECAEQIVKWSKKPITVNEFLKCHSPISKALLSNAKEMAGARKLIEWCYLNKMPMALVTSSTENSVKLKTNVHYWFKLIETRVLGDDKELNNGKPKPDPYLLAAKKLNTSPDFCWAIEDSTSGVKSALAAGCNVWVLDPTQKVRIDLQAIQSNQKIRYIFELKQVLDKLRGISSRKN